MPYVTIGGQSYYYPGGYWNTMGGATQGTTPPPAAVAPPPPAPPPPATSDGSSTPTPSTPTGESAQDIMRRFFAQMGLTITPDLQSIIDEMMTGGYQPSDIGLFQADIQNTQAFKTRFPGFHARVANGYNAISVGDYLNLEDQYHAILEHAGLPAGFYDDHSDFGNFIAHDVSPDEVQNRVQLAVNTAKQIDPTARNLMAQFYGLTTGDIAAYFLDSSRALPTIERQYNAAGVASWAQRNGFNVNDMSRYEDLVDKGVTEQSAAQGYGSVRSLSDTVGKIADTYGETFTQADAENDVFFNQSDKRQRIVNQERATFNGSGRAASTGTSRRNAY